MMTRTEYNRIKSEILARTDEDSISKGLELLEITAEERLGYGLSDEDKRLFIDEMNKEVPNSLEEYSTVFWGYFEDFTSHQKRPGVFVSDKDDDTIIAYALGDITRESYQKASKTYTLEYPAAAGLPKDTGVYLDKQRPVLKSDIKITGALTNVDVHGLARALGIDITTSTNIFDTIDIIVGAVYYQYRSNITTV